MKKWYTVAIVLVAWVFMGHDYWFEARPFIFSPGEKVPLHLLVGDDGKVVMERTLQKDMTTSFRMYHKKEVLDLLATGKEGDQPVAEFDVKDPGLYLVVMERDFDYITLNNEEFLGYLKHEEIADDQRLVAAMGKRTKQHERYARSVKSLLYARGTEDVTDIYRKVFGHPYEIVLLDNPYRLRGAGRIRARVLRNGKPVAGKKVMAQHLPEKAFSEIIEVSGRQGEVTFDLPERGEWLIRSLDLNPCEGCDTINWESHWASFSFYVPGK